MADPTGTKLAQAATDVGAAATATAVPFPGPARLIDVTDAALVVALSDSDMTMSCVAAAGVTAHETGGLQGVRPQLQPLPGLRRARPQGQPRRQTARLQQ